jgi:hypothetical protein
MMTTATTTVRVQLTNRDRAVLKAVAEGRCQVSHGHGTPLVIDGFCCSDQFVGPRLASAGLISVAGTAPAPARLTAIGIALLQAA